MVDARKGQVARRADSVWIGTRISKGVGLGKLYDSCELASLLLYTVQVPTASANES